MNIKKSFVFLILVFVFAGYVSAQYNRKFGANVDAMGGTGVVNKDIWASSYNQAGLAFIDGISAGVYFSNAFQIPEMGTKAFAFAMPLDKYGTVGVNYTYFGYELFNDTKYALNYSMRLGKRVSAGIQIDYFQTVQGLDYGKQGVAVAEIGILANPTNNLYIGAHLFNPWRAKLSELQNEYIYSMLSVGAGYRFSDKVILNIEIDKDIEFPAVYRAGIEYAVISNFFLRAGISTNPTQYNFGVGYNFKGLQLDVSFANHQVLGFYSQFGLSYMFKKTRKEK
jgi:hypothetical protein